MTGISRMLDFLTALKVNNDRQWFGVHKEEYNDIRRQCLEEVGVLIAEIERFDPHLAGVAPEQCVYRIYRDIRFSADKSPYKTHFGVVLGHGGKKCKEAAYYLHIDPDGCAFFSGVWFPRPEIFKMKEFLVQKKYKKSLFAAGNWQKQVAKDAQLAKPFNDFLNYAFEELHTQ